MVIGATLFRLREKELAKSLENPNLLSGLHKQVLI